MSAKLVTPTWSTWSLNKNSYKETHFVFSPFLDRKNLAPCFHNSELKVDDDRGLTFYFCSAITVNFLHSSIMANGIVDDKVNTVTIKVLCFQTPPRNLVLALGSSTRHYDYNQLHQVFLVHFCFTLQHLCPADAPDLRPWKRSLSRHQGLSNPPLQQLSEIWSIHQPAHHQWHNALCPHERHAELVQGAVIEV